MDRIESPAVVGGAPSTRVQERGGRGTILAMAAAPPMVPSAARLVSRYGERPSRRDGSPHFHAGLDISTGHAGDPVFAIKEGTVELVGAELEPRGMVGYGNCVVVAHSDGKRSLYAHLSSVSVAVGQTVRAGQQIGTMGSTTNGQFSPLPGADPAVWRREAASRGYRSGPMVAHLHVELRRPRSDGSSPFPGPYPRDAANAQYNLDPQQWFREHGMIFTRRGGIEVQPGGAADRSRAEWEPLQRAATGVAGLLGLGAITTGAKGAAPTIGGALVVPAGLPAPGVKFAGSNYEPVTPERSVLLGLTPIEWGLVVGGSILAVGGTAIVVRRRMLAPNRRRRR